MNLIFHPDADREFLEAIDNYETQQAGLGGDFYAEVLATFKRITNTAQPHGLSWKAMSVAASPTASHTAFCTTLIQKRFMSSPSCT